MTTLHELNKLGQSVWYDNMRRALLDHGEMQKLIDDGVTGVTSNPTIFQKAIVGSSDYDSALKDFPANTTPGEIYEVLAISDIQRTADMLRPIYDNTDGVDGYVSLEVSPELAHDTEGTIAEAKRLYAALDRPNVMIKIPATHEGIPAIAASIGAGISINVTLIFSVDQYERVANAYLEGLEKRAESGGDLSKVASVASFFISRIDSKIDKELERLGNSDLQGKLAIANAKIAFDRSHQIFSSSARWSNLVKQGARHQRLLWASTGTKNPHYRDTLYVEELIGPDTVNTMPPATLNAFMDHGKVASTLSADMKQARDKMDRARDVGIHFERLTDELQNEGVASFASSFEALMSGIQHKREQLAADEEPYSASLGEYEAKVEQALAALRDEDVLRRIWSRDHTVWKPEPTEIRNRLGWLYMPELMPEAIAEINALVDEVRKAGYTQALLLGMGGSSLAPEVFRMTFGLKEGYLDMEVLDSTDAGAVLTQTERLDPEHTLFIVSTKSGGTVETFSFFKFFYNWMLDALGSDEQAGEHFIAITDPGSGLVDTANKYKFRKTFLNDPNIGGRYSALSLFGLVPAALLGVDLNELLERAQVLAVNCASANCPSGGDNAGAWLGAIMGELALAGRDKITMITSPKIASFGAWAEQLIAESAGKEGKGILPVEGEPLGTPDVYGDDRLFTYLRLAGDSTHDAAVDALRQAGHPVVQINLRDAYALGSEFFRWELATAIAGRSLDINPFDQPDVESAKKLARQMVAAYQKEGSLPSLAPIIEVGGVSVCGDVSGETPAQALHNFLAQHKPGDYIAIQAYVQPTEATDKALQQMRTRLRDDLKLAVTVGYGPRFLHSTGQLHKGDRGNGLFIQITGNGPQDADIPDEAGETASSMTFNVLKIAQSLGDRQALQDAGRRIVRFDIAEDIPGSVQKLMEA